MPQAAPTPQQSSRMRLPKFLSANFLALPFSSIDSKLAPSSSELELLREVILKEDGHRPFRRPIMPNCEAHRISFRTEAFNKL
jgi:hypothetical protein